MTYRDYYSTRTGKTIEIPEITLKVLKKLFIVTYNKLEKAGYFQKHFGYYCVDQGDVDGELGSDIDSSIFLGIKKEGLWPLRTKIEDYSEDDLFDMIEFMHDHCSKPISGYHHEYSNCGYHYDTFNDQEGQKHYREKVNYILQDFNEGFEISDIGEVLELPNTRIAPLLQADIPSSDIENINKKMDLAVTKFRRHKSTLDDRRDALRELADVLEYLRPDIKKVLTSKDEKDLFNIANNFGIRHHNLDQKIDYDKAIWYSWIFYYYLATIHTALRLIEKNEKKQSS